MTFGVELKVPECSMDAGKLCKWSLLGKFWKSGFQRQTERSRNHCMARWFTTSECVDDIISYFVVRCTTNSVDKDIGDKQAGNERGHDGPWS
jgi:hypothetical protein